MKPTATMFCAAAVLMPTFQMLTACTVVIISRPAKRLFLSTPKARMMPIMIGITAAARAVALGTMNASTVDTTIAPITIRLVRVPTRDRITRAMRRSRPVIVIAAARKSAAATSVKAVLLKPPMAMVRPCTVPSSTFGLAALGAVPSMNRHQRGNDDGADGVVERLGDPDDDRKAEHRQHAMAGDRQIGRRRQQQDGNQRDDRQH